MKLISPLRTSSLPALIAVCLFLGALAVGAEDHYVPPPSPGARYNFNPDWRFARAARPGDDIPGFEAPGFNDPAWQIVGTPHTYNDVESFRTIISHGGATVGRKRGW